MSFLFNCNHRQDSAMLFSVCRLTSELVIVTHKHNEAIKQNIPLSDGLPSAIWCSPPRRITYRPVQVIDYVYSVTNTRRL